MFWLASCFSKIKKPNSHFLRKSTWDCQCSHFWHNSCLHESYLNFIDYDNNELVGRTILIHGTIVPYWKDAVGLGSFVCHAKSKKNGWKSWPSCWWRTLHQQEEAVEHNGCRRWFEQWSKSEKKRMETATKLLITNHLSTRGSHWAW